MRGENQALPPGMAQPTLCEECSQRIWAAADRLGLKTVAVDGTLYNPVNQATNMVLARCLEMIGIDMLRIGFGDDVPAPHTGCPLHWLEAQVPEDRSCDCGNPECEGSAPGSIKPFFDWLDSEDSAIMSVNEYVHEERLN